MAGEKSGGQQQARGGKFEGGFSSRGKGRVISEEKKDFKSKKGRGIAATGGKVGGGRGSLRRGGTCASKAFARGKKGIRKGSFFNQLQSMVVWSPKKEGKKNFEPGNRDLSEPCKRVDTSPQMGGAGWLVMGKVATGTEANLPDKLNGGGTTSRVRGWKGGEGGVGEFIGTAR